MKPNKTILSLFDYSGNWSKPYRDNGYNVIQVDIKLGIDIFTFDYQTIPEVYGILCAVPCTDFAVSGARWFAEKDKDGRTKASVKLVKKSLEIIHYFNPVFWALENPVGRIHKLVPELGKASLIFNPCDYGDAYTKKTCLWGIFNHPVKSPVEPKYYYYNGKRSSWIWAKLGGKSEHTKTLRSQTPMGFAQAFYEVNQ